MRAMMSPDAQQQFAPLFRDYLARVYVTRLSRYADTPFRVTGSRPWGSETVVTSQVTTANGAPVGIDWNVQNYGGRFLVTDVVVDGVSMKTTQRSEFASVIQRNGGPTGRADPGLAATACRSPLSAGPTKPLDGATPAQSRRDARRSLLILSREPGARIRQGQPRDKRICAMRLITVRIASAARISWLGAAMLATVAVVACVPVERGTVEVARVQFDTVGIQPVAMPEFIRVDPGEAAERAFVGGIVGGMIGASVGAMASVNPAFGAIIGGPAGAAIGAVVGIATTPPLPSYAPIAVSAAPVIPEFYDTWPPGYHSPSTGAQVPPPPPRWSRRSRGKDVPGRAAAIS